NNVIRAYKYDPATHTFPGQPNQRDAAGNAFAVGQLFASNDVMTRDGMPGAMLSLSSNGRAPGSAILWASLPPYLNANQQVVPGWLVAYDAENFDAQGRMVMLWHSHQNAAQDDLGNFPKFNCPTVAGGKVFMGTFSDKLQIYGLRAAAGGGYNVGFGGSAGLTF